jgi:AcrR family transcriptional regulator
MTVTNRAMTDAQKQERRADILKVALHRFTLTPYQDLSMAATAEEAGVAKGTLYLYFRSKEEMFLAIHTDQLDGWFDELDRELKFAGPAASIANFVNFVGESLARRPQMLRLIAILHTVLEQNLDQATARRFKGWMKQRVEQSGALLEAYLPFLEAGQGAELLLKIDALVIGFQHLAEPSGVMRAVLAEPDMALFRVDREKQLLETLRTLLMGLAYEAKCKHER